MHGDSSSLQYCRCTTHYSLLTTHYLLLTTHYYLLATHYSLLTTHYYILPTHYSLPTTHYPLLTTHMPNGPAPPCSLPTSPPQRCPMPLSEGASSTVTRNGEPLLEGRLGHQESAVIEGDVLALGGINAGKRDAKLTRLAKYRLLSASPNS